MRGRAVDLNNLNKELKERARNCASAEELLALAEEEGITLGDEELEGVTGGWCSCTDNVGPAT